MARQVWVSCSDAALPRSQPRAAAACFALAFAFLLLTHAAYLDLPYHWDELGYFIPAAHDVLEHGALVPRSTLPNVHPPLLMIYLAAAWKLFGFAIPVTRVAMLAVGAGVVAAAYALARLLAGPRAASVAAALLVVSPPFVAQSMMAHLDLPATLWTLLAIYSFLKRRWWLASAACTALVLTKETGIIVSFVLAAFAPRDKKLMLFAPATMALGGWLLLLHSATGHWLGNAEFARYNIDQALRLWRIPLVLLRRCYQLGFANFHWIASALLIVAVGRRRALREPRWRLIAGVIAAYLLLHSLVGGAVLVRYLLPAIALFYIATAAALEALPTRSCWSGFAVLFIGLVISNWWNPPYPFGYEDNLAVVDFIRLQQQAAQWLSAHSGDKTIATAWPLSDALSNPLVGYVSRPLRVQPMDNFRVPVWNALDTSGLQLVAVYSRDWEPSGGWQQWPLLARILERYFGYAPQVPREELIRRFHLRSVARWDRRGQWMEIFAPN